MLMLIDSTVEKLKAQMELQRTFEKALQPQGKYLLGFRVGPGEKNPKLPMYSNGENQIWFCSLPLHDVSTPRYWNAFGLFDPDRSAQASTVELNIPIETNKEQVAGLFARDLEAGLVYLLHSGRVGGGRKGIGKSAFLTSSRQVPVPVIDQEGPRAVGCRLQPGDRTIVARVRPMSR